MSTSTSDLRDVDGFWYVATVYTKHRGGIDEAAREAAQVMAWLLKRGVPCFSPICHTHPIAIEGNLDPLDHGFWLPADEPMMRAAHGLIVTMMDGWEDSFGISAERAMFASMGKTVVFLDWPQPASWQRPTEVAIADSGWTWDGLAGDYWRAKRLGEGREWMGFQRKFPHVRLGESVV